MKKKNENSNKEYNWMNKFIVEYIRLKSIKNLVINSKDLNVVWDENKQLRITHLKEIIEGTKKKPLNQYKYFIILKNLMNLYKSKSVNFNSELKKAYPDQRPYKYKIITDRISSFFEHLPDISYVICMLSTSI